MATTDEQYIEKIYDSQKQSALNALKSAYDSNVSSVDTAKQNTDTTAYNAKREAAGNAAVTRQRLNETFAANGLNTGAMGQANLALLNQKAAELNDIEVKRVAAQAEFDRQKAQLAQTYQTEVKNAILNNDADKAAALYKLYQQQQQEAAAAAAARRAGSSTDSPFDLPASTSSRVKRISTREEAKKELANRRNNGEITETEYLMALNVIDGKVKGGKKAQIANKQISGGKYGGKGGTV